MSLDGDPRDWEAGSGLDDSDSILPMKYVVNNILVYIQSYFNCSSADNIKKVVCKFYTPEAIADAKTVFYTQLSKYLGRRPNRLKSTSRDVHEADVIDIINGFQKLDRTENDVNVKFVAFNLENIPKYKPDETENDISVARISQNDQRIGAVEGRVDSNTEAIRTLQMLVQELVQTKSAASYAEVVKPANSLSGFQNQAESSFSFSKAKLPEKSDQIQKAHIEVSDPNKEQQVSRNSGFGDFVFPRRRGIRKDNEQKVTKNTEYSDFGYPRRKGTRQENIIGNRKNSIIKSGSKFTHLFVSRVHSDVQQTELEKYICDEGINVVSVKKLSHEEARMNSYKVTILTEEKETAMKDTFWPDGIACREFFEGRKSKA